MKLVTRILSFEWFAVCLIACVCAFSIKLLDESAEQIQSLSAINTVQTEYLHELIAVFQRHAIVEGRTQEGQSAPRELRQAEQQIVNKLKATNRVNFPAEVRQSFAELEQLTNKYLDKRDTLDTVLDTIEKAKQALRREQNKELRAAQEPAEAGITLIAIIGAIAVILSLVLSARSSRTIGQPLETLHRTVIDLTAKENAHRRIPDGNYDPNLRELGKAINQLAERLEQAENVAQKEDSLMLASAQQLIEGLKSPWIISDLSGRTRLSNRAARTLLQEFSPEELGIPENIRAALSTVDGDKPETIEVLKSSAGTSIGFAIRLSPPKTV